MSTSPTQLPALDLPWPPSVNDYWKTDKRGWVYLTKRAKQYREDVAATILTAGARWGLTGRLRVEVLLNAPTKRKCDLDNYMKGLLDSLEHAGVFEDDEQIDKLVVERGVVEKHGSALVLIEEIEQQTE